jgi:hypothetical protein
MRSDDLEFRKIKTAKVKKFLRLLRRSEFPFEPPSCFGCHERVRPFALLALVASAAPLPPGANARRISEPHCGHLMALGVLSIVREF